MKKIIFIVKALFCQRDYERFGIEFLSNHGFEVEVWDFTPFIRPNLYKTATPPDPINFSGYRLFKLKKEALCALAQLSSNVYIMLMIKFDRNTYSIFRTLNKKHLTYGVTVGKGLPIPTIEDKAWLIKIFNSFKKSIHLPINCFDSFAWLHGSQVNF